MNFRIEIHSQGLRASAKRFQLPIPDIIDKYIYRTDEELDSIIYELLGEAGSVADRHSCFTEADVSTLDGSERHL